MFTISCGSSPFDENCVQVMSGENYMPAMRRECRRYVQLLRKLFPDVEFRIVRYEHGYGPYLEVEADCDTAAQAQHVDNNLPSRWRTA